MIMLHVEFIAISKHWSSTYLFPFLSAIKEWTISCQNCIFSSVVWWKAISWTFPRLFWIIFAGKRKTSTKRWKNSSNGNGSKAKNGSEKWTTFKTSCLDIKNSHFYSSLCTPADHECNCIVVVLKINTMSFLFEITKYWKKLKFIREKKVHLKLQNLIQSRSKTTSKISCFEHSRFFIIYIANLFFV